jgi:membrane-bound serine protease (ClpP class)
MRPVLSGLAIVWTLAYVFLRSSAYATSGELLVVPIEGTVDEGMAHLVDRAVEDANASHVRALVLDINTPGGLVSSAFAIRDAMFRARMPTLAYVSRRAFSAGALIALSANRIVMAPGASLGAAEPIPKSVKTVSALRSEFASTASRNHRDPTLASAMVDANAPAPAYKKAGAILCLTADEALRAHYADAIEASLDDALRFAKLDTLPRRSPAYTLAEKVARFATSPEVSGLLLTLGFMGLLIEMQTLHGIAGFIGVSSLALFFGTHVYAGFSDTLVIALAVLGLFGILFELHVIPGNGFSGALGTLALLAAVVLAFGAQPFINTLEALGIALFLSAAVLYAMLKIWPTSAFFRRLTFTDAQGAEYTAGSDYTRLLGSVGSASSSLRPAGLAQIAGERVDVLTEGDFIEAGTPVRVSRVEGRRIFVKPLPKEKT